ncbi:MAG: metallophosphoesterase family protein, partial [Clostridia bacterium]|nr:metallophosphoesterase family protein [Clostridia bacterium]
EDNPPPLCSGDVLLCGHTHIPACRQKDGFVYLNPGSVSIPKNGSAHGYMTFENGVFEWKSLENGQVISSWKLGESIS